MALTEIILLTALATELIATVMKVFNNKYAWHLTALTVLLFTYYFIKVEMAGAVISNFIVLNEVIKGIGKWK